MTDPQTLLDAALAGAKKAGADAADALFVEGIASSVSYRLGKLEDVERAESYDLGLRVFVGNRAAIVSSTDFSPEALAALPVRAVTMARLAPEDKFAGLAPKDRLARDIPDLDLEDPNEPAAERLIELARDVEAAALAVKGVTNSEGGGASFSRSAVALATSTGFYGRYAGTSHSVSVSVLAGEGTAMERDYDHDSARHAGDLRAAEEIGAKAGEKAVRRLNPRSMKSQSVPVVFHPDEAAGLLGHFAGAISGAAIARGVSFLKDRMGQRVFAAGVSVIDDPHRPRGLRSKPFDGEGVANRRHALIADGKLTTWLMDCASARQLGVAHNGPGRARHFRAARPLGHQSLSGTGKALAGRTDRRYQERFLRHRTDGHGRQWRHRRLQPRRRRLLDREWRDRLLGVGSHHCRQSDRDVRQPRGGQRPAVPPRHQFAHRAYRWDDPGRSLM